MNTSVKAHNTNERISEIEQIFTAQREYFLQGSTLNIKHRKNNLQKLIELLKNNEEVLYAAIYKDFKKSPFETYETELAMIYHDAKTFIKNLSKWAKPTRVSTNFANMPGSSHIVPEPLGTSLVIGAWNYPYQLSLLPAVAALAAGNTVILKPSELAEHSSAVMAELINKNFPKELFYVHEGAIEETTALLALPFDKMFYTGSAQVGKIVMRAAAEHLSDVTLELGGKSPCFVFADAKLKLAAKRLVWGKFLNSGQSCVAPDYVMVEESVKEEFLTLVVGHIKDIYGANPEASEALVNIVKPRHFERIKALIAPDKIYHGGQTNAHTLFIEPTVLKDIDFSDAVMQEEIFGPILPVISFSNRKQAFDTVRRLPKPLAAYLFTSNRAVQEEFINTMPFGGATINDTMMHVSNNKLPFGGTGGSGLGGGYHGKAGFDVFSHYKSVLKRSYLGGEMPFKYPPFTNMKLKILKMTLE